MPPCSDRSREFENIRRRRAKSGYLDRKRKERLSGSPPSVSIISKSSIPTNSLHLRLIDRPSARGGRGIFGNTRLIDNIVLEP